MRERLCVGDIVRHIKRETVEPTKGNMYLYNILAIATHTDTKEKLVIYQALYSDSGTGVNFGIFARPYDMFMSKVDKEKYPEIKQEYRFEKFVSE